MKIYFTFSNTLSTFLEFLFFEIDNAISCEFCKINIVIESTIFTKLFYFGKSMGNTGNTMNSKLTNEVESVMKNENLEHVNRSNDKSKDPTTAEVGENLDLDLDQVHRSTDKLAHPAAERAKASFICKYDLLLTLYIKIYIRFLIIEIRLEH